MAGGGRARENPALTENGASCDLAVIGGGVIGAGIARDAALRGLSVILFEKSDFAAGTSSRSTRLIHGGLRYLQMLDFGLVRQDLREREILLRTASHLVAPLPFLIPFYHRSLFDRAKIGLGMTLYDALSFGKSLPRHQMLSAEAALAREPSLRRDGLQGAALYWDAQVAQAERLTLENALDARDHGAILRSYTRVDGLLRQKSASGREQAAGVRWTDSLTGQTGETRAKVVVNASGPWLDQVEGLLLGKAGARLRLTKGVHLAAPPLRGNRDALVLFSPEDGRLFFVIPWLGYAWVGTTDTDFDGNPDDVCATSEDAAYLMRAVAPFLEGEGIGSPYFTNAGVRALARRSDVSASAVSRRHRVLDHARAPDLLDGLLSVVGGKLTAYRGIAEEVVTLACRKLGSGVSTGPCRTDILPLPGMRGLYLPPRLPSAFNPPEHSAIRAQVEHAVAREECRTLADFMERRALYFFAPDQGRAVLPVVREAMTSLLGWDRQRAEAEAAAYERDLCLTQRFRE